MPLYSRRWRGLHFVCSWTCTLNCGNIREDLYIHFYTSFINLANDQILINRFFLEIATKFIVTKISTNINYGNFRVSILNFTDWLKLHLFLFIRDYAFKIIIVGDSSVGKSCLLRRFQGEIFDDGYPATFGVDFVMRRIEIDDKVIKLVIVSSFMP